MKSIKKKFVIIVSFLFLFTIVPSSIYATGSSTISLKGNSIYESGKNFTIDIYASNISGSSLMSVGGKISSSDTSCISLVSLKATGGTAGGNTLAYTDMNGVKGTVKLGTATFKAANKTCQAKITIGDLKVAYTDGSKVTPNSVSKTINIKKYSTDNSLSSLTISKGTLSPIFNTNTTTYNVDVDKDVSSININAKATDSKATVIGIGTKSLSYGNNKFSIVVTAENGSKKTYTININRKDDRSTNADLKSLVVNGGSLIPNFNSSTTTYSLSVAYEISKLNINAQASDSKAKVTIVNPNLIAEEVTNVLVKVVAENGATKTYTIKVTREKDPNKKLSNDNNLIKLEPNIGILSPVFDKNKTNYFIYLPYEIDSIKFNYEASDKKYATVKVVGSDKLKPDSANIVKLIVTAEDKSTKEYNITVYRAKNPEETQVSSDVSTRIKSLTLTNGELIEKFDSDIHTYTYIKKDEFSYEYELEDENAYSYVYETDDSIYIVVESSTGEIEVYCLHLEKENISKIHNNSIYLSMVIIFAITTLIFAFLYIKQKIKRNK